MSQSKANKTYRSFVRGLMTEASPLTYPENTSFDELNTVLSRKGDRTRRFGFDYAAGNATPRTYSVATAKTEYMWTAVGGNPALSFLVVQDGSLITFYDRTVTGFAATKKAFEIDLNSYTRPGVATVTSTPCKFACGKGYLFTVNADTEPLVVTYDKASDNIGVTKLAILGRDFSGLRDGLANDEEPSILTKEHYYNLRNQGWVTT